MPALIRIAENLSTVFLVVGILLAIDWWRNRKATQDESGDLDLGSRIDYALDTYSELLDNGCRDILIMEIAKSRVELLQREYEDSQIRKLEVIHSRKSDG